MSRSYIETHVQLGEFILDVNLELPSCEITAVFGPSGCGKTSLLRVLSGLDHQAQGKIFVKDHCWQDENIFVPTYQRRVGYVFQEASLFPHLNVQQNLCYASDRAKETPLTRLNTLTQVLQLGPLLNRSVHKLSGGERQRVAIARALLANPVLLLLDEPLAAVDEAHKHEILQFLRELNRALHIPMLYVSHSLDEMSQVADRLIVMEAGKAIAQGEIHVLLSSLLPLTHRKDAFSIVQGQIIGIAFSNNFIEIAVGKERLFVPTELRLLKRGQMIKLRIYAEDVSICLDYPVRTSILNILSAHILSIDELLLEGPHVLVRLETGGEVVMAKITRHALTQLCLTVGKNVFIQIKTTTLIDEYGHHGVAQQPSIAV